MIHRSIHCIAGEVERLLRDYKQNQELVRNLGPRYYQVVYPIQTRRPGGGVSTRELDSGGSPGGVMGAFGGGGRHYRRTSLLIKAFQHKFRLDLELNT